MDAASMWDALEIMTFPIELQYHDNTLIHHTYFYSLSSAYYTRQCQPLYVIGAG